MSRIAVIGLVTLTSIIPHAAIIADGEGDLGRVRVSPDGNGGIHAEAGVDMLALRRNGAVRDAAWYAKPFVAAREVGSRGVGYVRENPGKSATIALAGLVGVRAAQGRLDDDWDRLRGKGTSGRAGRDISATDTTTSTSSKLNVVVSGNNNNINIVNQQPQGAGTGMSGNTGTQAPPAQP